MSEVKYETWEKTTAGGVWVIQVAQNGVETSKRLRGRSGHKIRIPARDREATSARYYEPADNPFENGTLKRVDVPVEKVKEEIPGYDEAQALSDGDLIKLFASNGMAFQSKVKKLNERNARRLLVLGEENPEVMSAAQSNFLSTHIMESWRPGGPPSDEE